MTDDRTTTRSLLADVGALANDFVAFGGRRLGGAVVMMLAGGLLEGVGLALLVPIFSLLAPQDGGRWRAAIVDTLAAHGMATSTLQLAVVLLAFCLLVAVRAVVLTARDRLLSTLGLGFVDHQRLRLVTDLAHARWSALARLRHARIAHILSSEIGRLAVSYSTMMQILTATIMLAVQLALLVVLSPRLALLTVAVAALGLALIVPLSRRAADVGKASARFAFRIAGEAAHFLGGLKIAVAHGMADSFIAQVAADGAGLRAQLDAQQRFQSRVAIASSSIAALVGAAMVFGAVVLGVPTVTLLAALVILARMSGPVRGLQTSVQQLAGVLPAFTAVRDLRADLGENPTAISSAQDLGPWGTIAFEGVTFAYPAASHAVFTLLDLTIEPGEMVGLAGPSGVGKTTFVDLLTGLLEPDAGRIAVGGTPLRPDLHAGWRRRLAYVAQESYLINASIRCNLTWGGDAQSDAALWKALEQAGAKAFVEAMPDRLDTPVDERGTRLSGGERQRIALARALLRAPDLLILDEATNAIDVTTERRVIDGIRRALPRTTLLVVAHRAETLAACDRLVSLDTRSTRS